MTPLVVESELEVSETIDRRLSGNRADDGTNLIIQRNVLVAGSLRYEVRTLRVKCPELIGHDRLIRILERLGKRTNSQSHSVVNATVDAYVDVGDPLQGTDHVPLRDVVTGVQVKSQEGNTSNRLSGSWSAERCGNGTEVCLHYQSGGDNEE